MSPGLKAGTVVAWEHGNDILVATYPNLAQVHRIGKGQDPNLSADGTRIAFEENSKNDTRQIVVRDVRTGQLVLRQKGAFPCLSPDGHTLIFSYFGGSKWQLRSIRVPSGPGPGNYLPSTTQSIVSKNSPVYPMGWAGELLVAHSNEFDGGVSAIESGGKITRFVPFQKITNGKDIYIPFYGGLSGDLTQFVFEAQTGKARPDDEPETGIFLTDLRTSKTRRLPTPRNQDAMRPFWYSSGLITYSTYNAAVKKGNSAVYVMDVRTGETQKLLSDANRAVFAVPTKVA